MTHLPRFIHRSTMRHCAAIVQQGMAGGGDSACRLRGAHVRLGSHDGGGPRPLRGARPRRHRPAAVQVRLYATLRHLL